MIPTREEEDGEAQDAWVFHSTPSHPRIVPNSSEFSSLSPLDSSNSSHYIPGYSPHLFYSPGLAGSRARPLLTRNTCSEKRSQLLKRMREPEDRVSVQVVTECKLIKERKSIRRLKRSLASSRQTSTQSTRTRACLRSSSRSTRTASSSTWIR